jgi:uncharacterized protein (TIGR02246 family)
MRNFLMIAVLLLSAIAPARGEELTETRQAAARGTIYGVLNDKFIGGWNAHDAHLFATAFWPDADFTNVRGEGASGRDNIEKFHAEAFERFFQHSHLAAQVQKIRFLNSDVAVVDVSWKMTGATDPAGRTVAPRSGLLDLVFTASGPEWLITVMHNAEFAAGSAAARP